MGEYKTAQICQNGHVITEDIFFEELCSKYCPKCGETTITNCPICSEPIRGRYQNCEGFFSRKYRAPAYCHNCGKPFPWTKLKLEAARELINDVDELTDEERKNINNSFTNIISDNPMTTVSANKIRNVLKKIPEQATSCLRDILVDIASETAKKIIWPS